MSRLTDLGDGFSYVFFSAQEVTRAGIVLHKQFGDRNVPIAGPWFDTPEVRAIHWPSNRNFWTLVSLDPLHLEPSIQTHEFHYGTADGGIDVPAFHGFIREGRWVSA